MRQEYNRFAKATSFSRSPLDAIGARPEGRAPGHHMRSTGSRPSRAADLISPPCRAALGALGGTSESGSSGGQSGEEVVHDRSF